MYHVRITFKMYCVVCEEMYIVKDKQFSFPMLPTCFLLMKAVYQKEEYNCSDVVCNHFMCLF